MKKNNSKAEKLGLNYEEVKDVLSSDALNSMEMAALEGGEDADIKLFCGIINLKCPCKETLVDPMQSPTDTIAAPLLPIN